MAKKKLDQVVYEYIIKQIENGQLLQREHVTEQGVADKLEISRTPVRKAFNRLVEDNYLEMIENVGVRVKQQELDSKDFQNRLDFIERLTNHYLFDLEKKEWIFDNEKLQTHLKNMKKMIEEDDYKFERNELAYWWSLFEYSDNEYTKNVIMKAFDNILFTDGFVYEIMKSSRRLKNKHLAKLMDYLADSNYVKARREVRILFNQLKLNVIENQYQYK